jgi:hypothetical protein
VRIVRGFVLLSGLVLTGLGPGCMDLTPYPDPAATDAGLVDSRTPGPCEACLFAPNTDGGTSCDDPRAVCAADAKCAALLSCLLEDGCFERLLGEDSTRCGVPCYLSIGISSPDDPSITPIFDLASCSVERCPGTCFPASRDGAAD